MNRVWGDGLAWTGLRKHPTADFWEQDTKRIWGSHSGGYEEYYLLGYKAVQSVESQPKFRKTISPPVFGSKNKASEKPAWKQVASSAHSSTLKMEAKFFRNVGWLSTDYAALYPRRQRSSRYKNFRTIWGIIHGGRSISRFVFCLFVYLSVNT
jgi:hypothetical protein